METGNRIIKNEKKKGKMEEKHERKKVKGEKTDL